MHMCSDGAFCILHLTQYCSKGKYILSSIYNTDIVNIFIVYEWKCC